MSFENVALFPETAQVNNRGHLELGGCDVVELCREFGTPLYVFDESTLRSACRRFRRAFGDAYPDSLVLYASKAFLNRAIARLVMEEGLGLDVVSGGELAVARVVEFPPKLIYFHGNNKSPQELEEGLDYRIGRFAVDSLHEIELLGELARKRGVVQEVILRVSPNVDPHTHAHTTTGVLDSKFGFPLETGQADEAVRLIGRTAGLRLVGLHFHLGSPIFELEPYATAIDRVLEWAADLGDALELREFSPGGGFAIGYVREEPPPPVEEYAAVIADALKKAVARHGLPSPRLLVEPGRAIVGPAGVALYTVGAIKDIPGVRKYVSVDGGMGDNIRPALYGSRYEAVVANRMWDERDRERVTLAGKYCESGDVLIRDIDLPELRPGDVVAVPGSGAYAPSMASNYNLNPRPAIVMVREGQARLIRRRETYQDLMALDEV